MNNKYNIHTNITIVVNVILSIWEIFSKSLVLSGFVWLSTLLMVYFLVLFYSVRYKWNNPLLKIQEKVEKYIENTSFVRKIRMVCWKIRFLWRMRTVCPWDCQEIYMFISIYLNEYVRFCEKYGHLDYNKNMDMPEMRRIRECSILAERLEKDEYIHRAFKKHDVKYLFDQKKWKGDIRAAMKDWAKNKATEKERFFKLLKRLDTWWD